MELGKALMVTGWFFGIIIFLFGLLLIVGSPIAGLIVMFVGIIMCYGASRSGRPTASYVSAGVSNIDRMKEERKKAERRRAQQIWWFYNSPNSPGYIYRHHHGP